MADPQDTPRYESALLRFATLPEGGRVRLNERRLGILLQLCGDLPALPQKFHQDPDGITALQISPTRLWLKSGAEYESPVLQLGAEIAQSAKGSLWQARLEEGQVWLEIGGDSSRDFMQSLLPIDLGTFQQGQTARTSCAEVAVAVARYTDDAQANPRYAILCPRSFAPHLWEHLTNHAHHFS